MLFKILFFLLFLILFFSPNQNQASDLSHLTATELNMEVEARQEDYNRTLNRIRNIDEEQIEIEKRLKESATDLEKAREELSKKINILYRLSRNGKTVQYLFSSESYITFVKRFEILKRIVTSGIDTYRGANMEQTQLQDDFEQLITEKKSAKNLLIQLEESIEELKIEQRKLY